jgi:hypothetical protein
MLLNTSSYESDKAEIYEDVEITNFGTLSIFAGMRSPWQKAQKGISLSRALPSPAARLRFRPAEADHPTSAFPPGRI